MAAIAKEAQGNFYCNRLLTKLFSRFNLHNSGDFNVFIHSQLIKKVSVQVKLRLCIKTYLTFLITL